jgi:hypothetical protein
MLAAGTLAMLLSACGGEAEVPVASGGAGGPQSGQPSDSDESLSRRSPRYATVVTVIEDEDNGPRLCFYILDSLPPQCGDPVVREVVGLDWDAVPDAESSQGTTWADLRVVGTWDGAARRLTLTEAPTAPDRSSGDAMPEFEVPCPEPDGGWPGGPADDQGQEDAVEWLQERTDISATWLASPAASPLVNVLVVRVADAGTPSEVERGVRMRYSGPLCVVSGGRPEAELLAVLTEIEEAVGDEHVDNFLDPVAGRVVVTVMLATPELQAALDARFGVGTVVLESALQPAD